MRKLFVTVLAVLAALAVTACQDDSSISAPQASDMSISPDFTTFSFDDALEGLSKATLDDPADFEPPKMGDHGKGFRHKHKRGLHLYGILFDLQLTTEQNEQIKELLDAHKESVEPLFEEMKTIFEKYRPDFESEREAIKIKVQNGGITKEEAKKYLDQLHEDFKTSMDNDAEAQLIKTQLCELRGELILSIESLLTDVQLNTWNDWKSNIPQDDCIN